MINDRFFRDAFRDRNLSLRQVATRLGMKHHSQLSLLLKGSRRMQLDEAIKLSNLLATPLTTVIAQAGYPEVMREGRRISIVGALREGGIVEDVPPMTQRVAVPPSLADVQLGIQARTAGTDLMWMDRWVFFCGAKERPSAESIGRLCYTKIKDGITVLATVQLGYSANEHHLVGPYHAESATLEWVAPVIMTKN